jgi:hypothetical protein
MNAESRPNSRHISHNSPCRQRQTRASGQNAERMIIRVHFHMVFIWKYVSSHQENCVLKPQMLVPYPRKAEEE